MVIEILSKIFTKYQIEEYAKLPYRCRIACAGLVTLENDCITQNYDFFYYICC